jgi:hypothetical protein
LSSFFSSLDKRACTNPSNMLKNAGFESKYISKSSQQPLTYTLFHSFQVYSLAIR